MPDGLIVDGEGCVWSAHWAGWKLTRYDPAGRIEREVRFPVQHVICCAFGGEHLDELYVTTAWYGLSEEEKKKQPQAGDLFRKKWISRGWRSRVLWDRSSLTRRCVGWCLVWAMGCKALAG
jgi:sugar lactone lactonase YvrE